MKTRKLTEAHLTRNSHGAIIARPKVVFDPEEGMIMYDDPDEPRQDGAALADADTLAHHEHYLQCLMKVYAKAKHALPQHASRIDNALELVLAGFVAPGEAPHTYVVRSQRTEGRRYLVNGNCTCPDWTENQEPWCKHRLAVALYRRAHTMLTAGNQAAPEGTPDPDAAILDQAGDPQASEADIITRYSWKTGQTKAIRYIGLLLLAKKRGLVSLQARWIVNEAELSLAEAEAIFLDGTKCIESGDATPQNVTNLVRPHFRRMALTRAKARALRDALGLDMVAVEELGEL